MPICIICVSKGCVSMGSVLYGRRNCRFGHIPHCGGQRIDSNLS